jgi:ABC-type antimicrobial peptide transport system permease subunit
LPFADHQFTSVFDYEWLSGNSITALSAPNSVVLTETIAKKWFGKTDPMGQLVNLENGYNLKVTGLIKDLPGNTHLPFNFLVSFETIRKEFQEQGSMSAFYAIHGGSFAYIVTPPNMNRQQLQQRIPGFIAKNWGENIAKEARLPLQPLTDIHFDQRYLNNTISNTTSREIYWALAAVAVFIIIIACINFINLATAQAIRRAKEIGVRKVLGSSRSQLILQFIGETALMVITALLLSLAITALLLPMVAGWLDVKISFMQLIKPSVAAMVVAGTLIIILLAGLYPAFLQSGFNAATSLKSRHAFSYQGFTLRKCLVVLQFAISSGNDRGNPGSRLPDGFF